MIYAKCWADEIAASQALRNQTKSTPLPRLIPPSLTKSKSDTELKRLPDVRLRTLAFDDSNHFNVKQPTPTAYTRTELLEASFWHGEPSPNSSPRNVR